VDKVFLICSNQSWDEAAIYPVIILLQIICNDASISKVKSKSRRVIFIVTVLITVVNFSVTSVATVFSFITLLYYHFHFLLLVPLQQTKFLIVKIKTP
jgi:hypothetical protein